MAQKTAEGIANAEKYLVEISGASKIESAEKNKNQTNKFSSNVCFCSHSNKKLIVGGMQLKRY